MQVFDIPINKDRMETTIHGSLEFPLVVYHSVMDRNVLGYTNWHWHEELQFCLVTQGEIRFSVNQKQFLARTGEGIFINSGCLHMARPQGRPDSAYLCLDTGPRLLGSFHGSVLETKYLTPYLTNPGREYILLTPAEAWQKAILEGIARIYGICEDKSFGYEMECTSVLSRMWLSILRFCPHGTDTQAQARIHGSDSVQTILAFISGHYSEPLTIDRIAREVSLSSSECCRLFKRVTHDTIFSYLQSYRLSKAAGLLKDSSLPISQVAYETGFCSTSYFIEVFKRKLGSTPLQYRKSAFS